MRRNVDTRTDRWLAYELLFKKTDNLSPAWSARPAAFGSARKQGWLANQPPSGLLRETRGSPATPLPFQLPCKASVDDGCARVRLTRTFAPVIPEHGFGPAA